MARAGATHELNMVIPSVRGHTATEPFIEQVIHFGHALIHFRGRMTRNEKQRLFDASFERGDRRAALAWLREYCHPDDVSGLTA